MLLPGLMASQVPVTGGRSAAQILEEQGKGRGSTPSVVRVGDEAAQHQHLSLNLHCQT